MAIQAASVVENKVAEGRGLLLIEIPWGNVGSTDTTYTPK